MIAGVNAEYGIMLLSFIVMSYALHCDRIIRRRIKNQPAKVVVLEDDVEEALKETEFGRSKF
jgi:hypothetical protein